MPRIRKLVSQGFKPKDAVALFLQEVALEYRTRQGTQARAKEDGEDLFPRLKAGLIWLRTRDQSWNRLLFCPDVGTWIHHPPATGTQPFTR